MPCLDIPYTVYPCGLVGPTRSRRRRPALFRISRWDLRGDRCTFSSQRFGGGFFCVCVCVENQSVNILCCSTVNLEPSVHRQCKVAQSNICSSASNVFDSRLTQIWFSVVTVTAAVTSDYDQMFPAVEPRPQLIGAALWLSVRLSEPTMIHLLPMLSPNGALALVLRLNSLNKKVMSRSRLLINLFFVFYRLYVMAPNWC